MAERVRIEERRQGLSEGEMVAPMILGENEVEFKEIVAEGVKKMVAASRSQGHVGANVLTALEEIIEGRHKVMLSTEGGRAKALGFVRLAEAATETKFLATQDDAAVTAQDLTEAVSHVVQAEVVNRGEGGGKFAPLGGAVSRGLKNLGDKAVGSGQFKTWLEAVNTLFKAVFSTASKLQLAQAEGKLGDDYHAHVDALLGLNEQARHNAAVAHVTTPSHALASDASYLAVDAKFKEDMSRLQMEGLSSRHVFRLGDASNELVAGGFPQGPIIAYAGALQGKAEQANHPFPFHKLFQLPAALRDPIAVFKSKSNPDARVVLTEIQHQGKPLVAAVHFHPTAEGNEISRVHSVYPKDQGITSWLTEGHLTYWNKEKGQTWLSQTEAGTSIQPRMVHADLLKGIPTSEDVKKQPTASHSLASGDYLEKIASDLDAVRAKKGAPEQLAAFTRAAERLAGMARAVRHNDANAVKNLSRAGIEREQATMQARQFREAKQAIEVRWPHLDYIMSVLHLSDNPLMDLLTTKKPGKKQATSRIMSEAESRKRGHSVGGEYDGGRILPSFLFGGNSKPDALAQEAYEAGLIKSPSPDDLWEGISRALAENAKTKKDYASYLSEVREARAAAKEAARTWADKQRKAQAGVDAPRIKKRAWG